jgi:hypothetical protein
VRGLARARKEGKRLGQPPIPADLEKAIRAALNKPGRTEGVRLALTRLAEIERRRQRYPGSRERVEVAGRIVIVIDDGIATGATTRAALRATLLSHRLDHHVHPLKCLRAHSGRACGP